MEPTNSEPITLAARLQAVEHELATVKLNLQVIQARLDALPKPPEPEPVTLSAAKAAEQLGMDVAGVIALVKSKLLPGHQAKGRTGYTILQSDVEAFRARLKGG